MMPMPMPSLVPAPQEWTLAVHYSPFQSITRFAEIQLGMTLAVAELAVALSPLGLAGAVGRRSLAPAKAAETGSVVPMVRPRLASVPAVPAPKPVPPKPRPVRPAAKKTARPAAPVALKVTRPAPKPVTAAPVQAPAAPLAPAAAKAEAAEKPAVKARRAPKPQAAPRPEPKAAAPQAATTPLPKPPADPVRPRARRTPAKPSQPFKVEE
jgi:hypothetical protein